MRGYSPPGEPRVVARGRVFSAVASGSSQQRQQEEPLIPPLTSIPPLSGPAPGGDAVLYVPSFRPPLENEWNPEGELFQHYLNWFREMRPTVPFPERRWMRAYHLLRNRPYQRTRPLVLHALPQDVPFDGPEIPVFDLEARSAEVDIAFVTGVNFEILANLVVHPATPDHLIAIHVDIETFEPRELGLRCHAGTHRSVGMCHLLMLLAYPNAVCKLYSTRALAEARRHWREVEDNELVEIGGHGAGNAELATSRNTGSVGV